MYDFYYQRVCHFECYYICNVSTVVLSDNFGSGKSKIDNIFIKKKNSWSHHYYYYFERVVEKNRLKYD